jgi:hypothetical protein
MNIACLGWGSLVWNPKDFPIQKTWFTDGPLAPVEFSRQSEDGRITLVLDDEAQPVRLLWAQMIGENISTAIEALVNRENIRGANPKARIGFWQTGGTDAANIPGVTMWAATRGVDAVIWTDLRPQYVKQGEDKPTKERPSIDWVIEYLAGLTGPIRDVAEQYIRCAPPQIDTEYRRRIEAELGWVYRLC